MEVGQITSALSQQLVIEDIDENDQENPQLCAEYVKEIYEYMRELEVRCSSTSCSYYSMYMYGLCACVCICACLCASHMVLSPCVYVCTYIY